MRLSDRGAVAGRPGDRLRIGLVQINNSFSGQNYLPYSVGILEAHCRKHSVDSSLLDFALPLYKRVPVVDATRFLDGCDVVLFSVYVWNFNISLEIARRTRAENPEVVIAFGGPHVPDRADDFLRRHRFIDLVFHGEGERSSVRFLDELAGAKSQGGIPKDRVGIWSELSGVSYRHGESVLTRARLDRIRDLDEVPSPYLEGIFQPLMDANPGEQWIALWETNRGCPFQCTFCDWGSAVAGKVNKWSNERLLAEIDWFADRKIEFIFCCDANFGMLPRDLEIVEYAARIKSERGYPKALSVQNTKNATDRAYKVQKTLSDAGLNKGVDIALQSLDPETLKNIKRANISRESYLELQRRFTRDRVETYTDLILGMPGETFESFFEGVSTVVEMGQHNRIQFNNLSILPNAEMGDPEYQRRFGMETVTNEIINIHGALIRPEGDVPETQQLVIATQAMPRTDWVRTRALSWMISLIHFDKLLQIPLVLVRESSNVRYKELFGHFENPDPSRFPVLAEIRDFFIETARKIQQGAPEFVYSREWLGICWPADEYILIKLCVEGKIDAFYREASNLLDEFLGARAVALPEGALEEAVSLNREMLKRPFMNDVWECDLRFNVWDFYRGVLDGESVSLQEGVCRARVDRASQKWESWDDWCREVVWWGNKKGAYLYANAPYTRAEMAGHF